MIWFFNSISISFDFAIMLSLKLASNFIPYFLYSIHSAKLLAPFEAFAVSLSPTKFS